MLRRAYRKQGEWVFLGAKIPRKVHAEVKIAAAKKDVTMGEIISKALINYLELGMELHEEVDKQYEE